MPADERRVGGSRRARRSNPGDTGFCGLSRGDMLLAANEEPRLGSHLVTQRPGFTHHGIYVGRGNVVQYRSLLRRLCRGPVEEVSLARFAQSRAIWVRVHLAPRFEGAEVARRARSRLGENRYRLLSNNCEHFCEWCLQDQPRSYQVERLLTAPRRLVRICGDVIAWLLRDPQTRYSRVFAVEVTTAPPHATTKNRPARAANGRILKIEPSCGIRNED